MIGSITFRAVARGVRALVRPATLFEAEQPVQPLEPAPAEPAPSPADVDLAARAYFRAADTARRADREKRAAKKILDRVSAGLYGTWRIERVPSGRQVADLEAIRATYKRLGLGPVPMKAPAPGLKVTLAELEGIAA